MEDLGAKGVRPELRPQEEGHLWTGPLWPAPFLSWLCQGVCTLLNCTGQCQVDLELGDRHSAWSVLGVLFIRDPGTLMERALCC